MADKRQQPFYISQLFTDWQKPKRDDRVQLNPRTAVLKREAQLRMQQLVGLTALLVIFLGIMAINYVTQQSTTIRATFNFQHSLIGKIISVDKINDSFTYSYQSSIDQQIVNAKMKNWSAALIPGKSITTSVASDKSCYLIDNLSNDLGAAKPADCSEVVTVGRQVLMDYVFLNFQKEEIVVQSIIGKK